MKGIFSSPLNEKRISHILYKKHMIGRRAYSDTTKLKPINRKIDPYENKKNQQTRRRRQGN